MSLPRSCHGAQTYGAGSNVQTIIAHDRCSPFELWTK